jgi:hypothetical protein
MSSTVGRSSPFIMGLPHRRRCSRSSFLKSSHFFFPVCIFVFCFLFFSCSISGIGVLSDIFSWDVQDSVKVVQGFIARNPESVNFNVIAVAKDS